MGALAEDSVELSRGARALRFVALAVGVALLVAAGMWLKDLFSKPSAPTRQVTKISIIPDTPPPPPPPPKEEKRPEPKETKEVKVEQPKPVEAPPQQAEQLKMEDGRIAQRRRGARAGVSRCRVAAGRPQRGVGRST